VLFAETNYQSTPYVMNNARVYQFLDGCVARGIIPVSTTVTKPLSRARIGGILRDIMGKYSKLNDAILEAELDYYIREFATDFVLHDSNSKSRRSVRAVSYNPADALSNPHWHAADWSKENFSFVFDPIISADWNDNGSKTIFRRSTGIKFRGVVNHRLGFSFKFTDHVERGNGKYVDREQLLEDHYGYVGPLMGGEETYYDLNSAYVVTSWSKFDLMFGKEKFAWGLDENRLLFSGDAPPFSQLRLTAYLTSNIKFTYVVGKLKSWNAIGDTIYTTANNWERIIPPEKWVVGHRLDYSPISRINLSVSEALIWGDRGFDFSYLNPLAFLYSAEHDGGDLDNVLLSGDISVQLYKSMVWSASLLIDDMKTSTLGTGDFGNKFAWSTGIMAYIPIVSGVMTSVSYIKVDPYVYSHFFPINRFSNWTSGLGTELAPNSDRFTYQVSYKPIRELQLGLKIQQYRHGDLGGSMYETVVKGENPSASFWGGKSEEWTQFEISANWEILPGLDVSVGRVENDKTLVFEDRYFLFFGYRY